MMDILFGMTLFTLSLILYLRAQDEQNKRK